jgi:hypothetical protein
VDSGERFWRIAVRFNFAERVVEVLAMVDPAHSRQGEVEVVPCAFDLLGCGDDSVQQREQTVGWTVRSLEHKTASLLLYALQTASTNLRQTNFKPFVHEVILDPRDAAESILDQTHLWDDEDFEEEVEEEEVDEVEQEIRQKEEEAAKKARFVARWEAKKDIEARERGRKRYEEEEKLRDWVHQNPGYRLVRRDGRLVTEKIEQPDDQSAMAIPAAEKKPPAPTSTDQVRAQINDMIRKQLPALTAVYNGALQKEAEKQAMKKQPQKETLSGENETKSTAGRS